MTPPQWSYVFLVVVVLAPVRVRGQLFEDEECTLTSGADGYCKKIQDCPEFKDVKASGKKPVICSFNQTNSIVCCPKNVLGAASQLSEISTQSSPSSGYIPTSSSMPLERGDPCTLNGLTGECRALPDCPAANTIASGIPPKLCHFQQSTPIVCCPESLQPTFERPTNPKPDEPRRTSPSPPWTRSTAQPSRTRSTTQSYVTRTTTAVNTKPRVGRRRSVEMCDHYSQFVFQMIQSPTLFIIPEWHNESQCNVEVRKNTPALRNVSEARFKEFPHITRLGYGNENNIHWHCEGSLISDQFILTAGRCITSPNRGIVRWARLGDLEPTVFSPNSKDIQRVVDWITPENSVPNARTTIALLKLDKYMNFNGQARPACLHPDLGKPLGYRFATTAGWGMINWNDTETTNLLMKQDLVFSTSRCPQSNQGRRKRKRRQLEPGHSAAEDEVICMASLSPRLPCVGGLGAPLHIVLETPYCMHSILAVNTGGNRGCPKPNKPAIFTRIHGHIPWIESQVWT